MLLVLMSILSIICVIVSTVSVYVCYRAVKSNFEMQTRMDGYKRFFSIILNQLEEDTSFLRSELIRTLSMEIQETKHVNSSIIKFQNNLTAIKTTLKEYKMLEGD
jgi:hypothetical protein